MFCSSDSWKRNAKSLMSCPDQSQRADKLNVNSISVTYALLDCSIFDFIWMFFSMPVSVWRTPTVQLRSTTSGSSCKNLVHLRPLSCASILVHSHMHPCLLINRKVFYVIHRRELRVSLDTSQVVDNMLQQTFHLHHPAVRVKSHFH